MTEQLALLPDYLTAHIQLTVFALLAGLIVSLPLGIWLWRTSAVEPAVMAVAGIIQTIPSLALLALMVPALAAVGLRSIGFLPAFIGLSLYSVLPMLRNTVAGLKGVDPTLVEAAQGVGMTPGQRLWRVELPLALPVVLAGIRTSTVWTTGMATLSTPVGARSLGNYIFTGLQTRNLTAILVGCVAAAGLALLLDGLVAAAGSALLERKRFRLRAALVALASLVAYAGVSFGLEHLGRGPDRIVIGTKTFTEQYVLGEMLAATIRGRTGQQPEVLSSLGSTVAFDALRNGDIDVYVDYSGTIWTTVMQRQDPPADRAVMLADIGRFLEARHGVHVVGALGFENTYALAMPRARARRLGIASIGDLRTHAPVLSLAGDYEFFGRPEWRTLRDTYGLAFQRTQAMDASLMYEAAARAQVDVISAFSTDGRLAALDMVPLVDERHAIPPYDALILAGARLVARHPDAVAALRTLTGTVDADAMRRMNLSVDREGVSPGAAATAFLERRAN